MSHRIMVFLIINILISCNFSATVTPTTTFSSDKEIKTFSICIDENEQVIECTIEGKNISGVLPYGTNLENLVGTFEFTGAMIKVNGVVQESGISSNDFTRTVFYVVFAEDGSTLEYQVNLVVEQYLFVSLADSCEENMGFLHGEKISVSPGHGLNETINGYDFQRTEINGVREDLLTQSFCRDFLYGALERSGASVIPLRQSDSSVTGLSGSPAWHESSLPYIQTADIAFYNSLSTPHDTTIRPLYAISQGADFYVSVHFGVNINNSLDRGTVSYLWDPNLNQTPSALNVPSSTWSLCHSIHNSVIETFKHFDATWTDKGVVGSNLGELRPLIEYYNGGGTEIPAILIELGYLSNLEDLSLLSDDKIKKAIAYAIVRGIANQQNVSAPPREPEDLTVTELPEGYEVTWTAGSINGVTAAVSHVLCLKSNSAEWQRFAIIAPGVTQIYIRKQEVNGISLSLLARNTSGDSLPTLAVEL